MRNPIDKALNRGYVLLPLVGTSPPPGDASPLSALYTGHGLLALPGGGRGTYQDDLWGLPPMKPRHGRAGVGEFFDYVATMQIQDFQVLEMLASDRQVVVEVQISIATADGGAFTDEELHLYSLNDEGKINRMRHYVDTAKQIKAYGLG